MLSRKLEVYHKRIDRLQDEKLRNVCLTILVTMYSSLSELPRMYFKNDDIFRVLSESSSVFYEMNKSGKVDLGPKGRLTVQKARDIVRVYGLNKPKYKTLEDAGFNKNIKLPLQTQNGGIMYGPPGNGKSFSWQRIQKIFKGCNFFELTSSEIQAKGLGSSIEKINDMANRIKFRNMVSDYPFTIIFFDEMEILRNRSQLSTSEAYDGGSSTTSHLLKHIGEGSTMKILGTFWLGATNLIQNVDDAISRDGRLGYRYFYGKPNKHEVGALLRSIIKLKEESLSLDIDDDIVEYMIDISEGSINYSGIRAFVEILMPKNMVFDFLQMNKKTTLINSTPKTKKMLIDYISNISENNYSKIRNSRIFTNVERREFTHDRLEKLFMSMKFHELLTKKGMIEIKIVGMRMVGKTTLAFKMINYIIEKYRGFQFEEQSYMSPTTKFESTGSPYETRATLSYKIAIIDEVDAIEKPNRTWPSISSDTYIIIRIFRDDKSRGDVPSIIVNGNIVLWSELRKRTEK